MTAHPWLNPLHRRVVTTAVCAAWLVFELFQQERLWLFLAACMTAYAVWDFFLSGHYPTEDAAGDGGGGGKSG